MLPRSVTRLDQEGPQQSWRPPHLSGFRSCFKEGIRAEAYSTLSSHGENKAYTEILTFNFIHAAPVHDDTTDAGIAWWKYRAALISRAGCGGMRRIAYVDQRNKVDLALGEFCLLPSSNKSYMLIASYLTHATFIEWDKANNATAAHAESIVTQCLSFLTPYLLPTSPSSPLSGVRFDSLPGNTAWAEVVDFNLLSSATAPDRRAFEFYIHDFCGSVALFLVTPYLYELTLDPKHHGKRRFCESACERYTYRLVQPSTRFRNARSSAQHDCGHRGEPELSARDVSHDF